MSMSPSFLGMPGSFGPLLPKEGDKLFHGKAPGPGVEKTEEHTFSVIRKPFQDGASGHTHAAVEWDSFQLTAVRPEHFCGNCELVDRTASR